MDVVEASGAAEQFQPIPHEEWLLRLNFNPEHIVDGQVVPTAVSLSDLDKRGYSIDRECILNMAVVIERAQVQSAANPEGRKSSFLSRFMCKPICDEVLIPEIVPAFVVEASPQAATDNSLENLAHAHVKSASSRSKSTLRRLRLQLIKHLQCLVALQDYAVSQGAEAGQIANSIIPSGTSAHH